MHVGLFYATANWYYPPLVGNIHICWVVVAGPVAAAACGGNSETAWAGRLANGNICFQDRLEAVTLDLERRSFACNASAPLDLHVPVLL